MNESNGGKSWEVLGLLGKGKFSSGFLVKNASNDYFCWKTISNSASASNKQRIILENELLKSLAYHYQQSIGIHKSSDNSIPNIVSSFGLCEIDINSERHQNAKSEEENEDGEQGRTSLELGILLSLGICGTLSQHLRFSSLSVQQCRIYSSEIFHALMFLQNYPAGPILHRDLKASNILIDNNGHVLVSDFGCAKILTYESLGRDTLGDTNLRSNGRTFTMPIGTEHILAPEMVALLDSHMDKSQNVGYDETVDFWALGTLIYEMLTQGSLPPFQDMGTLSARRITAASLVVAPASTNNEIVTENSSRIVAQGNKYWDFHLVDNFWSYHFPPHLFVSSHSPEKVSHMSLEKLSKLVSLEEEDALKLAHICMVNLFSVQSSDRRKYIQQLLSPQEFNDMNRRQWLLTETTDNLFVNSIAVDKRLGCSEWIEQLEDRHVISRNNSIIEEENVFAGF